MFNHFDDHDDDDDNNDDDDGDAGDGAVLTKAAKHLLRDQASHLLMTKKSTGAHHVEAAGGDFNAAESISITRPVLSTKRSMALLMSVEVLLNSTVAAPRQLGQYPWWCRRMLP